MRKNIIKVMLGFCMVMGVSSLTNATLHADAAESEYIVYHNGEVVENTGDNNSLTEEILQENNISIQSLTKKEKEHLEQKGFTVEKDRVVKANAVDSGKTDDDRTEMVEQWNLMQLLKSKLPS